MTSAGKNISDEYELAFKLGFLINVIDGVNTSCVNMHYRFRVHYELKHFGLESELSYMLVLISTNFEWFCRASILGVSVYQLMIMNSQLGAYCMEDILAPEADWLSALI